MSHNRANCGGKYLWYCHSYPFSRLTIVLKSLFCLIFVKYLLSSYHGYLLLRFFNASFLIVLWSPQYLSVRALERLNEQWHLLILISYYRFLEILWKQFHVWQSEWHKLSSGCLKTSNPNCNEDFIFRTVTYKHYFLIWYFWFIL